MQVAGKLTRESAEFTSCQDQAEPGVGTAWIPQSDTRPQQEENAVKRKFSDFETIATRIKKNRTAGFQKAAGLFEPRPKRELLG